MRAAMASPALDHLASTALSEVMAARRSAGLTIWIGIPACSAARRCLVGAGLAGRANAPENVPDRRWLSVGGLVVTVIEKGLHVPARVPGPPVAPKSLGNPRTLRDDPTTEQHRPWPALHRLVRASWPKPVERQESLCVQLALHARVGRGAVLPILGGLHGRPRQSFGHHVRRRPTQCLWQSSVAVTPGRPFCGGDQGFPRKGA